MGDSWQHQQSLDAKLKKQKEDAEAAKAKKEVSNQDQVRDLLGGGSTGDVSTPPGKNFSEPTKQSVIDRISNLSGSDEDVKTTKSFERSRQFRELDRLRGEERGEKYFSEGALGRIDEGRSSDMQQIMDQRKQLGLHGFDAPIMQAQREQRLSGVRRAEQQQMRDLKAQQSRSGITGPMAQAQMTSMMQKHAETRQQEERAMMLENASQRQAMLGNYEQSLQSAESAEQTRSQYNIGQSGKELMGRLTTELGEMGLGVSERTGAMSAEAAKEGAAAMAKAGGGGKK